MSSRLLGVAVLAGALVAPAPAARADLPITLLTTGSADRGRQAQDAGAWHAADPASDRRLLHFGRLGARGHRHRVRRVRARRRPHPAADTGGRFARKVAQRVEFVVASADATRVLVRTYERLIGEDGDEQQDLFSRGRRRAAGDAGHGGGRGARLPAPAAAHVAISAACWTTGRRPVRRPTRTARPTCTSSRMAPTCSSAAGTPASGSMRSSALT